MNHRMLLASVILVAAILISVNRNSPKPLYGNDIASIIQTSQSIKFFENSSILVLGIQDFDKLRIVPLLADDRPGYITFRKNQNEDYVFSFSEPSNNESLGVFTIPELPNRMLFVTSEVNQIAKIQVTINGKQYEQTLVPNTAAYSFLEYPESKEYRFDNYKFYNINGSLVKE